MLAKAPEDVRSTLDELKEKFELESASETGGNGYVVFAKNRITRSRVALKFYYWGGDEDYHLEPMALQDVAGKTNRILAIYDAGLAGQEWAYFVTPFCEEGDLDRELAKGFRGINSALELVCDIAEGVAVLHVHGFIHRDLKPANIYSSEGRAIIGDFGSIASIPKGQFSIKASQHALLYLPPESSKGGAYSKLGDIYQMGLILYQFLGGRLPYLETEWLTLAQRGKYDELPYPNNTIFASDCIRSLIEKGKIADPSTMHPCVSNRLCRIVKRATHKEPQKRYQTAHEFLTALADARQEERDWAMLNGYLTLTDRTSFRTKLELPASVEKRRSGGWRKDSSFHCTTLKELIADIESRPQN